MTRRKIMLSMIMTVFIMLLVSESMSQTRRTYRPRTQPNRFQPPPGFRPPKFGSGGNSSSSSSSTSREVTEETKEKSIKGAVGATDEQWIKIKPLLEEIKQLKEACMVINTGGGGGGSQSFGGPQGIVRRTPRSAGGGFSGGGFLRGTRGGSTTLRAADGSSFNMSWAWDKPWAEKGALREDEKLCDRLFNLLRSNKAREQQIKKTMIALNQARETTRQELAYAQEKLREILTLEQEGRLIVLGWLD